MKTKITSNKILCFFVVFLVALPMPALSQYTEDTAVSEAFTKEQLAQMLAPIALYPDSLIAQILIASTYPLEVVEAERWLRHNKNLRDDALNDTLKEKPWDPSIKSLCHFPEVLISMSEKLDQTRQLGDAFLSQEEEVMATIQELRQKAEEQGNLKTTKEQQVIIEREMIRIEPADPEVVYVPVYDPFYVYGPWWYPAYPPYYWYYPQGYVTGSYISFGPRVYIGIGLFSWVWFDWPVRHIHIDIHKSERFHRYDRKRDFDRPYWKHNPSHRKGVAYRERETSQRFGSRPSRVSPTSPETRGYPVRKIERPDRQPSQRSVERSEGTFTTKVKPERKKTKAAPVRDTSFRGIGEGSFERKASERGGKSRQRQEISGPDRSTGSQGRDSGEGGSFRIR